MRNPGTERRLAMLRENASLLLTLASRSAADGRLLRARRLVGQAVQQLEVLERIERPATGTWPDEAPTKPIPLHPRAQRR